MDVLIGAVYDTLDADSELGNRVSGVKFFRRPDAPQKLAKPVVIFRLAGGSDAKGLHGAALNTEIEFDVWGYQNDGYDMAPDCVRASQRISELLIGSRLSMARGGHLRFGESMSWGLVPQEDPDVILLRATFTVRYWSGGRIDAVTS